MRIRLKTAQDWKCKESYPAMLHFKTKFELIKFVSLSVAGYEEVQWKEKKFTRNSVSAYEKLQWKENIFMMDSVSEIGSEI